MLSKDEAYLEAVDTVCMGCAYDEEICEFCPVRKTVNMVNARIDAMQKITPPLKKYCVHFGTRLTNDYYIKARNETEAVSLARSLWEDTSYDEMEYGGDDYNVWEDDTIDEEDIVRCSSL